jgi:hypothetical protein
LCHAGSIHSGKGTLAGFSLWNTIHRSACSWNRSAPIAPVGHKVRRCCGCSNSLRRGIPSEWSRTRRARPGRNRGGCTRGSFLCRYAPRLQRYSRRERRIRRGAGGPFPKRVLPAQTWRFHLIMRKRSLVFICRTTVGSYPQ